MHGLRDFLLVPPHQKALNNIDGIPNDKINDVINKFNGCTVLHYACAYRQLETVKKIISKKNVDLNKFDIYQRTPLYIAATQGYDEIVRALLKNGANPNIKKYNQDVLHTLRILYNNHINQSKTYVSTIDHNRTYNLNEQNLQYCIDYLIIGHVIWVLFPEQSASIWDQYDIKILPPEQGAVIHFNQDNQDLYTAMIKQSLTLFKKLKLNDSNTLQECLDELTQVPSLNDNQRATLSNLLREKHQAMRGTHNAKKIQAEMVNLSHFSSDTDD